MSLYKHAEHKCPLCILLAPLMVSQESFYSLGIFSQIPVRCIAVVAQQRSDFPCAMVVVNGKRYDFPCLWSNACFWALAARAHITLLCKHLVILFRSYAVSSQYLGAVLVCIHCCFMTHRIALFALELHAFASGLRKVFRSGRKHLPALDANFVPFWSFSLRRFPLCFFAFLTYTTQSVQALDLSAEVGSGSRERFQACSALSLQVRLWLYDKLNRFNLLKWKGAQRVKIECALNHVLRYNITHGRNQLFLSSALDAYPYRCDQHRDGIAGQNHIQIYLFSILQTRFPCNFRGYYG